MKTAGLVALALALVAFASPGQPAAPMGPLSPAAEGKIQCFGYDRARKTCNSMASYAAGPGDTIENTSTLLIARDPPIVMTSISPVTIEGERVCGAIRAEDLQTATFLVSGAPPPEDVAATLRDGLLKAMTAMIGKRACVTFVPDGGDFVARATMDAVPQPDSDQPVIWVSPGEGWKVAP